MLVTTRQLSQNNFNHIFVTNLLTDMCFISTATKECAYCFPFYIYPDRDKPLGKVEAWPEGQGSRRPNLSPEFVKELEKRLKLKFIPHPNPLPSGEGEGTFGPEDIFHYVYAIFHSPTYRSRYAEFLKIDFPRVPLTSDAKLFHALSAKGQEMVALHLLESPALSKSQPSYNVKGDNLVEKGYPKWSAGTGSRAAKVHINREQYFEGVPEEVWNFHVGGYQVCEKWLKDRRGRKLEYADIQHYQKIVVALKETIRLMAEIDQLIPEWPLK
jgi:predicted helicase